MKILDLLYLTKILVTAPSDSPKNNVISFKADVVVKEGHSFIWAKDLTVTGTTRTAHFPWTTTASIEGPVAVMTGFFTFTVHCSYDATAPGSTEETEVKVVIPADWLTEEGYTDIRINYDKCMKIEEYAQYTGQVKEETEIPAESVETKKRAFKDVDMGELKSTLQALVDCLSKMEDNECQ
jgi:hypothetical protein